ncbi:ABC transporter substrate-binding protein [Bifidobacterium longum]|uniref:ABC transporter substrate-binding protein n=1 Tax=Bifidobacterium longum TaxID=216816 RepID=UPI0004D557CF|nr:sugar ABC transporter substrate-binding protein [Bifidobacterium longum]KEY25248.1 ABC transporter substrate-binding protein [Bifidobacterium longum subsp. longum 7-1B]RDX13735.1 sugar ABC transporter substrate-binding protein [Bifidobacterium longum]
MKFGKKTIALIGAVAMLSSVAACGSTSAGDGGSTGSSDKKVELTVWSWDSTLPRTVKGFEAKNPNIKVKVTNAGTNKDEYNALSNAIEAGSGAPDIAQIEYYALPEYVIRGHLENLSDLGASDFKDFYTPGTWSSVNINDGVYALPMDSGPMAWFYNKGVFDKAGVDPTQVRTWDDFYEAAKKIRAVDSYITSDSGDAGFFDSMTWLAGAKPFQTSSDGSEVTVNLTEDKGVKTFTDFWQKLLDEGLLDTKTAGWSEDWFKGMVDGTIASLFTGAWMPANLANSAADGAGKWRVTQMPTADGSTTNSENGGSSLAVLASTKKADAAYQFIEYANHGDGVATRVAGGAFPADKASMESDSFKNTTTVKNADGEDVDYFGGQKYNEVLAQAAENVSSDYQFLPYEVKARTIFGDYLGKSYTGDQKLTDGIAAWQKALQDYGKDQGFTVK